MKTLFQHIRTTVFVYTVICSLFNSAKAQTRADVQNEINLYKQKTYRAFTIFLDPQQKEEVRIKAVEPYNRILDEKQFLQCVEIVKSEREPDKIRATALLKTHSYAGTDIALFEDLLKWVTNMRMPELRAASLYTLELVHFTGLGESKVRQDFYNSMRGLTKDRDHNFRRTAFEVLTEGQDEYALSLILKSLASLDTSLLSIEENIGYLNNYHKKSTEIYTLTNNIFNKQISDAVSIACMGILGGYEPAKEKIISILQNTTQTKELRLTALKTLEATLKSDELLKYLSPIIFNEREDESLRATALQHITYVHKANQFRQRQNTPGKFSIDVYALSQNTSSAIVKSAAVKYVDNVYTKY